MNTLIEFIAYPPLPPLIAPIVYLHFIKLAKVAHSIVPLPVVSDATALVQVD
jgi:hypothetical protein